MTSGTLEPTYRQLQTMKLDKSPFVIISVIGQELLAQVIKISLTAGLTTLAIQAKYNAAVMVLESALKIGTCSLKLRGSVFSALSSAYWALNSLDKVSQADDHCHHQMLKLMMMIDDNVKDINNDDHHGISGSQLHAAGPSCGKEARRHRWQVKILKKAPNQNFH